MMFEKTKDMLLVTLCSVVILWCPVFIFSNYLSPVESVNIYNVKTKYVFFENMKNYNDAKLKFDNKKNDEAFELLNKVNLKGFKTLKNDLIGDIYMNEDKKEEARDHYLIAMNNLNGDNYIFKELIYAKYTSTFQ